jgi:hypothetical protein
MHVCSSGEAFTSENVARFFDIYESELRKVNHPAHKIFNLDETRITTVQHRHSKFVSMRGKKDVESLTSAERGNLITVTLRVPLEHTFFINRVYEKQK